MTRTLQQIAQEAIDIQSACNSCGLAQAFARVMLELGEHTKGTDERNKHPIVRVWLDKLVSLSGSECFGVASHTDWNKIYDWAEGKVTQ